MSLNRDAIGKRYRPTVSYGVCREQIRAYAATIGDHNPAFHNVDAARQLGYPDIIAPPTFPFTLTYKSLANVLFDPDLGLDYGQVVHGGETFDYIRPIHAGDELTVTTTIADIRTLGHHEYLTTRSEVRTEAGDLVVTTEEVLVSRGTGAVR